MPKKKNFNLYKVSYVYTIFTYSEDEDSAKELADCYIGELIEFSDPTEQSAEKVKKGTELGSQFLNDPPYSDGGGVTEKTIRDLAKEQGWVETSD